MSWAPGKVEERCLTASVEIPVIEADLNLLDDELSSLNQEKPQALQLESSSPELDLLKTRIAHHIQHMHRVKRKLEVLIQRYQFLNENSTKYQALTALHARLLQSLEQYQGLAHSIEPKTLQMLNSKRWSWTSVRKNSNGPRPRANSKLSLARESPQVSSRWLAGVVVRPNQVPGARAVVRLAPQQLSDLCHEPVESQRQEFKLEAMIEPAPDGVVPQEMDVEAGNDDESCCSICWETMDDQTRFMLGCSHVFCVECLRALLDVKLLEFDSSQPTINCPWKDCAYGVTEDEILALAGEEMLNQYLNHALKLSEKVPNARYCPRCSVFCAGGSKENPQLTCSDCKFQFCFFCLLSWHGLDVTCEEFAQQLAASEQQSVNLVQTWIENEAVKLCPNCGIPIMKNDGCNHMKCVSCTTQFCWLCLGLYSGTHYTDLSSPCFGKQFWNASSAAAEAARRAVSIVDYPEILYTDGSSPGSLEVPHLHEKSKPLASKVLVLPYLFSRLRRRFNTSKHVPISLGEIGVQQFNITMLGDSGTGKTPIGIQFVQNIYVDTYDPTIEDTYRKQIQVDDVTCTLSILDTSGMEEFSALRDQWIRSANGFVIVFRPDSRNSFYQVNGIVETVQRVMDAPLRELPVVLVGNAWDLGIYDVSLDEITELANNLKIPFIPCSARDRVNIDSIFQVLTRLMLRKKFYGVM